MSDVSHPDCAFCNGSDYETLKDERDELRQLLSMVTWQCHSLHHSSKDRHIIGDPCPIEARFEAAREATAKGDLTVEDLRRTAREATASAEDDAIARARYDEDGADEATE